MFKEVEEEYSDLPICISQGVSGQAVFVGLQEGLGPFIVDTDAAMPSRLQTSYMDVWPLSPSRTIRIFSSAENLRRVAFLICVITSLDFVIVLSSFPGSGPDYGAKIADFKCFPACRKTLEPLS